MLTLTQVKNKSAARLAGLLPVVAAASERLIERCYARGVSIVITQGYRSAAEQDALYAQGRTKPGSIVTNARAGYSYHNFGVAIDFALLSSDGKQVHWDTKRDGDGDGTADWSEVVQEAKALGFAWGGDWTSFKDYPHFEMTFGISTGQYRAGQRPTAAQLAAATSKIEAGDIVIKVEDANDIIQYLKAAWAVAKGKNNAAGMKEANRLANVLRKASGQKEQ
ncbi:peptidoglycan L-alanyl-D-glutamate endopeptidase CwlK [Paenibacillus algorifonticola]|uniref:Peptidoglycan L-alanyl-D-glutamate endopeptidase CwlK n=1 Tax=Paenibacillus algorifonticola TaxID=684063 RepID=A0A1I2AGW3_9BACL|nr:M15 family metallopeptidase [Paenibacillus algorifonticola]SFE43156.1 peptidoglycan L-alanyl-D-glutamate endopeptidase CwlK [Paenibacillus algorifonticola]